MPRGFLIPWAPEIAAGPGVPSQVSPGCPPERVGTNGRFRYSGRAGQRHPLGSLQITSRWWHTTRRLVSARHSNTALACSRLNRDHVPVPVLRVLQQSLPAPPGASRPNRLIEGSEELAETGRDGGKDCGQGLHRNPALPSLETSNVGPVDSGELRKPLLRPDTGSETQRPEVGPDLPAEGRLLVRSHAAATLKWQHRGSDSIEVARYSSSGTDARVPGKGFTVRGLVLVSLLLCFAAARDQQRREYGAEWRSLSTAGHTHYIGGLQEGQYQLAFLELLLRGEVRPEDATERNLWDSLGLTRTQRMLLGRFLEHRLNRISPERYGTEAVARVVSDLYEDSANNFIPWDSMVGVALMRLGGASGADLELELETLRKIGARR